MEAEFLIAPPIVALGFRTLALDIDDPDLLFEYVSYIHYLLYFQKDITDVKILIDYGSKVNVMTLAYISKLCLKVRYTNVGV